MESEKNFNKILEQGNSLISKENEIKQLKLRIVHLENYNEECMFQKRCLTTELL